MFLKNKKDGFGLLEVLLGIGLLVIFTGGIYFAFNSILISLRTSRALITATELLNDRAEFIRNLSYASIGTQGGIPAGNILPTEQITRSGDTFMIQTTVRNIDDPFDGTLGGVPNDTAPADYKLIELHVTCVTCPPNVSASITVRAAPAGLETTGDNGALFIIVSDANVQPVAGANIVVANSSTIPNILISDVTNADGMLQLVDAPTSTESYRVTVTKSGYSSEQTYPPGDPANPNPVQPHGNVSTGLVTKIYFYIDKLSAVTLNTNDYFCNAIPDVGYTLSGTKLIGTNPDPDLNVKKYNTTSTTDGNGTKVLSLEWDIAYYLSVNDVNYNFEGVAPYDQGAFPVAPSTTITKRLIVSTANPAALQLAVYDATTSVPLDEALITLEGSTSTSAITGHRLVTDTNWAAGNYSSKDESINTDSLPGSIILQLVTSTYPTDGPHWLIGNTIDFGSNAAGAFSIDWTPQSQPVNTDVKFQIATNNDNASWNFVGPDGTASTFYMSSSTLNAIHQNNRYLRYKVFLTTNDEIVTPRVDDITFDFMGGCIPSGQILKNGLATGIYTLTVSRAGYATFSTSTSVDYNYQRVGVGLFGL